MEYVKCNACGNYTPANLPNCENCGEEIRIIPNDYDPYVPEYKFNNGFTSFWLWFITILNSIMAIFCLASIINGGRGDRSLMVVYNLFSNIGIVCGCIMLMRWRRNGFYVVATLAVISQIISIINLANYFKYLNTLGYILAFAPLIGLLILYAVLQLRSYGKSYWEQLE